MTPSLKLALPNRRRAESGRSRGWLGRILALGTIALLGSSARAATLWWDGTGAAWSTLSSWGDTAGSTSDPAAIPGAADIAAFSVASVITAQTVDLGTANQSALGLVFLGTNPSTTLIQAGGTDRTLTLGASGITVHSSAGAVAIGSPAAGQHVAIVMSSAQSWTNNSANTLTVENAVSNGGFLLTAAGTGNTTLNGDIDGAGGLAKDGTGTLTLSGANSYTGGTTVQDGVLVFLDDHSGSSDFSTSSPATLEFQITSGQQQLSGGVLTGNGTVVKSGAGELWLGANGVTQSISMTGGLIDVQGGLLRNEWGRGDWTNNKASLNVAAGATVDLWDSPGGITVDALTGGGLVTHTTYGAAENLTVGVNNGSGTFSGTITNQSGHALSLVKTGSGTQALSGANSYTGGTIVQDGVLVFLDDHSGSSGFSTSGPATLEFQVTSGQQQLSGGVLTGNGTVVKSGAGELWLGANGVTQSISMTGGLIDVQGGLLRNEWGRGDWTNNKASLNVAAGATVDLWDSPVGITVDALTGGGLVTHTSYGADENLTVGVNSGSGTFSGTITNQSGHALNLVKTGSGMQTLSGPNSYTGLTTISEGTLRFANTAAMSASSAVSVSSGATLAVNAGGVGEFTTGTSGNGTIGGLLSGLGGQSGSTVAFASGSSLGIDTTNAAGSLTYSGAITNSGLGITKLGAGTLTLAGPNSYTGLTTISEGTLQFANTAAMSASSAVSVSSGATLAVNAGGVGEFTTGTSGNGTIGGLLSGLGGQSGSTVAFASGSSLGIDTTNAAGSLTYSGAITNSGLGITKLGAGTLTLAGANTYSGPTVISDGTLEVGEGGSLANTGITVNLGGTLLLGGTTNYDRIGDNAPVILNGGMFVMDGGTSFNEQVGVLSLSASSVIDFGTFAGNRILSFADTDAEWGGFTLSIWNWTQGTDHLYFGNSLTTTQLGEILFFSDGGSSFLGTGKPGPDNGEISTVPEPSTVILGISLLSLAAYRERRWLFRSREARRKREQ